MAKEMYIAHNYILDSYTLRDKPAPSIMDFNFSEPIEIINYLSYLVKNKKIIPRKKIRFIIKTVEEDFIEFKSELEKILKKATFVNKGI